MAFKSNERKDIEVLFARYTGLAAMRILAFNPSKKDLERIYPGRTFEKEPQYVTTFEDGRKITTIAVHLTTKDNKINNGITTNAILRFNLQEKPRFNKDETKVQVIDTYGETAWLTVEDAKAGNKPSTGRGLLGKYRKAAIGEEDLIDFLKIVFGAKSPWNYNDGDWQAKPKEELAECEFGFSESELKAVLKGDCTILNKLINNNTVVVLLGVKQVESKLYQTVANKRGTFAAWVSANKVDKIAEEIAAAQNAGAFPGVDFGKNPYPLQEYNPVKEEAEDDDLPFGGDADPWA